jgi:N6-L-threonylcarbamoyladenine synthase
MLVLGIESTCDETGISLVQNGCEILANEIASQAKIHSLNGGVIPELASRCHSEMCLPLMEQALFKANVSLKEIDGIAVAHGPGLIGALLVGLHFAKGLALGLNKPFVGINHIEAHLYAVMMDQRIPLPALGVVISGGHTALLIIRCLHKYQLIGQTQDDAIGEAFDKVAMLLGLPYPGGPEVEHLAQTGDPYRFPFKSGHIKNHPYNFSFSGLKTAVLYQIKGQDGHKSRPSLSIDKSDIAASFQRAALSDIVSKSQLAAKEYHCNSILLGGGVSSNKTLRQMFRETCEIPVYWPAKDLALDNAAMIAGLGFHQLKRKPFGDSLDLDALPRIPLDLL